MALRETADIQSLRCQPWFDELEKRILSIWLQGEGDLRIEIRNSRTDRFGRRLRSVKIEGGAIYRSEEQGAENDQSHKAAKITIR
jgi:hypothetical protein